MRRGVCDEKNVLLYTTGQPHFLSVMLSRKHTLRNSGKPASPNRTPANLQDLPSDLIPEVFQGRARLHVGEGVVTMTTASGGPHRWNFFIYLLVRAPRLPGVAYENGTLRNLNNGDSKLIESALLAIKVYNRTLVNAIQRVVEWSPSSAADRWQPRLWVPGFDDVYSTPRGMDCGLRDGNGRAMPHVHCFELPQIHRTSGTLVYFTMMKYTAPRQIDPLDILQQVERECKRRDDELIRIGMPLDEFIQLDRYSKGSTRVQLDHVRVERANRPDNSDSDDDEWNQWNYYKQLLRMDLLVQLPHEGPATSTYLRDNIPKFDTRDREGPIVSRIYRSGFYPGHIGNGQAPPLRLPTIRGFVFPPTLASIGGDRNVSPGSGGHHGDGSFGGRSRRQHGRSPRAANFATFGLRAANALQPG